MNQPNIVYHHYFVLRQKFRKLSEAKKKDFQGYNLIPCRRQCAIFIRTQRMDRSPGVFVQQYLGVTRSQKRFFFHSATRFSPDNSLFGYPLYLTNKGKLIYHLSSHLRSRSPAWDGRRVAAGVENYAERRNPSTAFCHTPRDEIILRVIDCRFRVPENNVECLNCDLLYTFLSISLLLFLYFIW